MPNLFIDIEARFAKFQDSLDQISRQTSKSVAGISRSFAGIGTMLATLGVTASAAGLGALVRTAINAQDEIGKMAQRVGSTAESLSALQYSAKLSDVSVETLGQSLKKLSVNMLDTQSGTGEAKAAFNALGISVVDTNKNLRTSEDVLFQIADKFAVMEDSAGKTAISYKLFGLAGNAMIPLLNSGAEGLRKNAEEAKRFGIVISTDAAKAAEAFNDNLTRLGESSRGFALGLANSVIPILNQFVEKLLEAKRISGSFGDALRQQLRDMVSADNAASKIGELQTRIQTLKGELAKVPDAKGQGFFGRLMFGSQRGSEFLKGQIKDAEASLERAKKLFESTVPRTDDEAPGRSLIKAPMLPDDAALKKAAKEAEEIRKLYEEVRKIGESIDVSVPFINSKEQLEKIKKTLEEGKKDWIAYADAVFETAEAEDKAAASGESFTQFAEKIKNSTLDTLDGTRKWTRELENLRLVLDTTNLSQEQFNAAILKNPLRRQYIDLIDPIQKYRDQLEEVRRLEELGKEKGGLTADEATAAIFAINEQIDAAAGLNEKLKETDDWAKQIGLTFASAFEDAVAGGKKFSDILKGLAQDIAKLILRKNVTEPLANAVGGFNWGKLLGGIFGGAMGGGGTFGSNPEFATGTNYVPRTGLALVHQGERIIPAAENMTWDKMTDAGGGATFNFYNDFQVGLQAEVRAGIQQELPRIARVAEEAVRAERNRTGDQR